MNRSFQKVAFVFFLGLGIAYLGADFLLHQGQFESEWLELVYKTFDMPFYFSAGLYFLSLLHEWIEKRFGVANLNILFIALGIVWTVFLIYLNAGFESLL